jgi:hypothetical protein
MANGAAASMMPRQIGLDGAFGGFLRNVLWAYFGQREFLLGAGV